jgi:PAS domain S-box-containing protein
MSPAPAERPALLLVDDSAENLFALAKTLDRDDVDVIIARSGREALELLLERTVALAIIDVQMPEMDGFELATLMRGVERTRHVPIIFATAGVEDDRRIFAGYEAGAVDFLFKPIDAHVLQSKVDVFITLEKQKGELRRNEARFRTLVQTTSQAVWTLTPDGRIAEDSPSYRALTGASEKEWLAHGLLASIHPEDRSRFEAALAQAREKGLAFELEFRLRRADGQFTWSMARVAPVFDEAGRLIEWIGCNADIQARKETENLRETFVAILGHDLRSPLGAVLTGTELVLTLSGDEAIRRPLERVQSSAERMARMIDQLLDLTRVRLGTGIAPSPVAADLMAIVEQTLDELPGGRERVRLEATGDPRGTWDPDRLLQVLSNLGSNALAHSPPGTPVHLRLDAGAAETVELSVQNFGPAVPAELRAVIFEPFRGSTSRNGRASRGLGLGLFITRQIVCAHGGTIGFETSDERGTVFRLTLPRHCKPCEEPTR